MKTLQSLIAILILSTTLSFAGTNDKVVKAVYKDGKIIPCITLNTVEIRADKKVSSEGTLVSDNTYPSGNSKLVKATVNEGKVIPYIELKAVEVVAEKASPVTVSVVINKTFSFLLSLMSKAGMI